MKTWYALITYHDYSLYIVIDLLYNHGKLNQFSVNI